VVHDGFRRSYPFAFILGAPLLAQEVPQTMTKIVVRLQAADVPAAGFACEADMTQPDKLVIALVGMVVFVVIGIMSVYWWANTTPSRPNGVPNNAVFLWAPYVGLPAPRRGNWLNCWEDPTGRTKTKCRLTRQDGAVLYEGEFISYGQAAAAPASQLRIDTGRSREHRLWVGDALVPLVYLDSGRILIPAARYKEGTTLLDRLKSSP